MLEISFGSLDHHNKRHATRYAQARPPFSPQIVLKFHDCRVGRAMDLPVGRYLAFVLAVVTRPHECETNVWIRERTTRPPDTDTFICREQTFVMYSFQTYITLPVHY